MFPAEVTGGPAFEGQALVGLLRPGRGLGVR